MRCYDRLGCPNASSGAAMPSPFKGGAVYVFGFAQGGKLRTELYIDSGDAEANTQQFERLEAQRTVVEDSYGSPLSWEELPDRRACRIADYGEGDVADTDRHGIHRLVL